MYCVVHDECLHRSSPVSHCFVFITSNIWTLRKLAHFYDYPRRTGWHCPSLRQSFIAARCHCVKDTSWIIVPTTAQVSRLRFCGCRHITRDCHGSSMSAATKRRVVLRRWLPSAECYKDPSCLSKSNTVQKTGTSFGRCVYVVRWAIGRYPSHALRRVCLPVQWTGVRHLHSTAYSSRRRRV